MSNIWVTTDWHAIEIDERTGRKSISNSFLKLTRKAEKLVQQNDIILCLGDIAFRGQDDIVNGKADEELSPFGDMIRNMPGYKILVKGNHDGLDNQEYLKVGFQEVGTAATLGDFLFTHKPYPVSNDQMNVHGHTHHEHYIGLDDGKHIAIPPTEKSNDPPLLLLDDVLEQAKQKRMKEPMRTVQHLKDADREFCHKLATDSDYLKEVISLEDSYEAVMTNGLNESIIIPQDNFILNYDKWDYGMPLWITGASGDGKSTLVNKLAKDNNAIVVSTDYVLMYIGFTPEEFENKIQKLSNEYGLNLENNMLATEYINTHPNLPRGLRDPKTKTYNRNKTVPEMVTYFEWVYNKIRTDIKYRNQKYIIEGCEISHMDPDFFVDKPIIIMGGSRIQSFYRRIKRDNPQNPKALLKSLIKHIRKYPIQNAILDSDKEKFRNNLSKTVLTIDESISPARIPGLGHHYIHPNAVQASMMLATMMDDGMDPARDSDILETLNPREIDLNETGSYKLLSTFQSVKKIVDNIPKEEHHWFYNGDSFKDSPYVKYRNVMHAKNKAAGFIDIYTFDDEPEIGIIVIALEPNARGTGLAEKLVKQAIKDVPSIGITQLFWRADTDNIASYKLAKKLGFMDISDLRKNPDQYKLILNLNKSPVTESITPYDVLMGQVMKESLDTIITVGDNLYYISPRSDGLDLIGQNWFPSITNALDYLIDRSKNKQPMNPIHFPGDFYLYKTTRDHDAKQSSDYMGAVYYSKDVKADLIATVHMDETGKNSIVPIDEATLSPMGLRKEDPKKKKKKLSKPDDPPEHTPGDDWDLVDKDYMVLPPDIQILEPRVSENASMISHLLNQNHGSPSKFKKVRELRVESEEITNSNDTLSNKAVKLSFYDKNVKVGEASISAIDTNNGFLYDFEVFKQYRGRGYGRRIMQYIMSHYSVTDLTVDSSNMVAINLYKSFGFKRKQSYYDKVNKEKLEWYQRLPNTINETIPDIQILEPHVSENASVSIVSLHGGLADDFHEVRSDYEPPERKALRLHKKVLEYKLANLDEGAVDYLLREIRAYKIRFDRHGNVRITKRETNHLKEHFNNSVSLLRAYRNADDVASVKQECMKLRYMSEILLKYYIRPNNHSDEMKELINLRSTILNALNTNLKWVKQKDPKYNFAEEYDRSKYGSDINLPRNVVRDATKTIVTLLV